MINEENFAVRHVDGIEVMTNEKDVKIYLKPFQYYNARNEVVKQYNAFYYVYEDKKWERTNEMAQYNSIEEFVNKIKHLDVFSNAFRELKEMNQ